jgi:uncharacterized protein YehS (DUF1456 family)
MNNNDLLRRLSSMLELNADKIATIFTLGGCAMNGATVELLLKQEAEDGFIPCADPLMAFFLEGLIIRQRGPRDTVSTEQPKPVITLDNNTILKKLRIAMDLKEPDMLAIMALAGASVSKSELGALFRTKGNKHFKACSDEFLNSFLQGLALFRTAAATGPQ